MRIFMLVSVICLVIALFGAASVLNGVNVDAWFIGGMLAWAADVALGSYALGIPMGRRQPPVG